MKKLSTQVMIDAVPAVVWDTLMDFAAYPEWNPFIPSIEGEHTVGSRLKVRIEPPIGRGATFRPTVTAVETTGYFEWLGHVGFKGIFDGRHQFRIEATSSGTRFTQSEEFTGVLAPLLFRSLEKGTVAGFEMMNHALKDRAEKAASERG